MRKQRKEEETKIIAQMEEALRENEQLKKESEPAQAEASAEKNADVLHCHKCGTVMENGKCPQCGYYVYVPMNPRMQRKIRLIVGGVFIVVFLIFLLLYK